MPGDRPLHVPSLAPDPPGQPADPRVPIMAQAGQPPRRRLRGRGPAGARRAASAPGPGGDRPSSRAPRSPGPGYRRRRPEHRRITPASRRRPEHGHRLEREVLVALDAPGEDVGAGTRSPRRSCRAGSVEALADRVLGVGERRRPGDLPLGPGEDRRLDLGRVALHGPERASWASVEPRREQIRDGRRHGRRQGEGRAAATRTVMAWSSRPPTSLAVTVSSPGGPRSASPRLRTAGESSTRNAPARSGGSVRPSRSSAPGDGDPLRSRRPGSVRRARPPQRHLRVALGGEQRGRGDPPDAGVVVGERRGQRRPRIGRRRAREHRRRHRPRRRLGRGRRASTSAARTSAASTGSRRPARPRGPARPPPDRGRDQAVTVAPPDPDHDHHRPARSRGPPRRAGRARGAPGGEEQDAPDRRSRTAREPRR